MKKTLLAPRNALSVVHSGARLDEYVNAGVVGYPLDHRDSAISTKDDSRSNQLVTGADRDVDVELPCLQTDQRLRNMHPRRFCDVVGRLDAVYER